MASRSPSSSSSASRLQKIAAAQKTESRRRLLDAARALFSTRGYLAPSVDDIARIAGLSRQTLYRHFDGKFAIALTLLEAEEGQARGLWQGLSNEDARRTPEVAAWMERHIAFRLEPCRIPRALVEMAILEPAFMDHAHRAIAGSMAVLSSNVPAFAVPRDGTAAEIRRHAEAWLCIAQMLEQFSNVSLGFEGVARPTLVQILADGFVDFVRRHDESRD